MKFHMNKAGGPIDRIKIGLTIAMLTALMGCVGYVGGGYGGAVIMPEPEVVLFGGVRDRGPDVHAFSQRGVASRAMAHPASGGEGRRR